ncbi:MAG: right-handed parallel beta-helix repeat-containing protein [Melioribacteraceae bacterium]
MKKFILLLFLSSIISSQIYISPNGNDTNIGSISLPLQTIKKAFDKIKISGDTIYLREGTYSQSITLEPPISGDSINYKFLIAYYNEKPIIDFSGQSYSSSNRGIKLTKNYWHLKGIEIKNAGDNGIHISGNYNTVENCILHHNKDTGLQISNGGSYNQVINCDSYSNYDSVSHGENADGFAPKLDVGPGNYFKNCRAYNNSDDGWDCYESQYQIIIDSCWSFHNGYNIWGDNAFAGDGNGFKLGGNYISANMIIRNSIAFDNVAKGFDQNHNTAGITVYNCTAFRNGTNFSFSENPNDSIHILKNNISLEGDVKIALTSIQEKNSWNLFTISSLEFVSLDTSLAFLERNENFNFQKTDFLRLTSNSKMIDAGINVGINFNGSAPDLGAFEYEIETSVNNYLTIDEKFKLFQNYPNPFNPITTIEYSIPKVASIFSSRIEMKIYDILGREVTTLVNQLQNSGHYKIQFDGNDLSSGIYYYQLKCGNYYQTKKMILMK